MSRKLNNQEQFPRVKRQGLSEMSSIESRVKHFFRASPGPEDARHLLDRLQHQADVASEMVVKRLSLMTLIWIIIFGVSKGVIGGGEFSSFKLSRLEPLLLIGPVFIAMAYYGAMSAVMFVVAIEEAISAFYKAMLPTAHDSGLYQLTRAPTILETEDLLRIAYISPRLRYLHMPYQILMVALFALAPLALIAHASYVAATASRMPVFAWIISIVIAGVLWLRAFVFAYVAFRF